MKITSPTLYTIYSNSRGFYLGNDKYGRPEFSKTPKYNDGVKFFPEKEGMEMLGIINDPRIENKVLDLRLVSTQITASFDLSGT